MLKFVQRFMEKTANFLFGGYVQRETDSYETLLKAMERQQEPPPDEVHQVTPEQLHKMKREFFSRSLQGGIASLHFDPRMKGVVVPERFRKQELLVLNYSYRYHIADFDFDDDKVVASLSFGGNPFQCVVPWNAVMGIGNQAESMYYSFVAHDPLMKTDEKQSLQNIKNEKQEFDQVSHERALERRNQFKVIKGEKE